MGIDYQRIGERLRTLRELKNVSLSELANKTNFTSKSLLLAENGKAALSLEFLLSICNVLQVTPNDILKGQFPEEEFTFSAREALIDDFVVRVQEIETGTSAASKTKINDTDRTLDEIGRMVTIRRREIQDEAPVPKKPDKWKSSYFK